MAEIGKITDAEVERLRQRLGAYYKGGPTLMEVSEDAIYNYSVDNGEVNPLYLDPEYAQGTRFGGLTASPGFLGVIKHQTAGMVGGLPGVHSFHAGNDVTFYKAVLPGDVVSVFYRPYSIGEKHGSFGGRMILLDATCDYVNQRGERVALAHGPCLRVERSEARDRGKYKDVEKTNYTDDDLEKIWHAYDCEEVRGAVPRYWEDVQEGDSLPSIVRGPLRVGEIAFRATHGGGRNGGAGGVSQGAYIYHLEQYRRHTGLAEVDSTTGVADHPHRGHWEDEFARLIGVPGIYDLAVMRTHWMATLVTNWVGDAGWLRRVWDQFRLFNVEGDTNWVSGEVVRKWGDGSQHMVEVEIRIVNQRGDINTAGGAEAVLPSRENPYQVPG